MLYSVLCKVGNDDFPYHQLENFSLPTENMTCQENW